jgi:hypothetical protein
MGALALADARRRLVILAAAALLFEVPMEGSLLLARYRQTLD